MSRQLLLHTAGRRLTITSCLALTALIAGADPAPVASLPKPLGACALIPAAESLPFEEALIDTWRTRNGVAEILHNVHCSDGRTGTAWIPADLI